MKKIIAFLFLIFSTFGFAQKVNQFDEDNKRHGVWRKNFDGTTVLRYEGEFYHGKEVGIFKFYKKIEGRAVLSATKLFSADSDIAEVKFLSSEGNVISEGKMNKRLYVGEWKYYHKGSKTIMTLENYNNNGKLEGIKKVFYNNGQLAEERNYVNGNLEGEAKWYSEKGVLIKQHWYKNNVLHGLAKHYNIDGDLIVEGQYKDDKKHGIWKYYENGKLVKETDFTRKSKNPKKQN